MRQVLQDLCSLLDEQKAVLEEILRLSQEQRRVIISGESDKLEDVVRLELRAVSKLGTIEKKRVELHSAISAEFDLPDGNVNVSAIAERAAPHEQEAIRKLQKELMELIAEQSEVNSENKELIGAHMEYTEIMMNLMVDSEDPLNNFYGGDGKTSDDRKKTTGFFDSKA